MFGKCGVTGWRISSKWSVPVDCPTTRWDPDLLKTAEGCASPRPFQGEAEVTGSSRGELCPVHSSSYVWQLLEMSGLVERYTNVPGNEVWEMTLCSWHSIGNPWGAAQLCSGGIWKASSTLGSSSSSMRSRYVCPDIQRRLKVCGCSCFYSDDENACKVWIPCVGR